MVNLPRFSGFFGHRRIAQKPAEGARDATEAVDRFETRKSAPASATGISRRGVLAGLMGGLAAGRVRAENRDASELTPDMADVALVLAMDVSDTMTQERFRRQREGVIAALKSPEFKATLESGINQAIVVCVVEWALTQKLAIPWQIVRTQADIDSLVEKLDKTPRMTSGMTNVGGAITFSDRQFETLPIPAIRKVIDVSGDDAHNTGRGSYFDSKPADEARDEVIAKGVTINGLPITGWNDNIADYYQQNVIGGPRHFMVVAKGIEDIARAFRQKLIYEIAGRMPEAGGRLRG